MNNITIADLLQSYILSDVLYNQLTDKYIRGLYFAQDNNIIEVIFKDKIDTFYLVSARYLYKQLENANAKFMNNKWVFDTKDTQLELPIKNPHYE